MPNHSFETARGAPLQPRCPRGWLPLVIGLLLILVVLPAVVRAQEGTVLFNNRVIAENISAPVYDSAIGGELVAGSAFLSQLYSGPAGTPENLLVPTGAVVDFRTALAAGFLNVGAEASRAIPGVVPGAAAVVQIRVWNASAGASYEVARRDPSSKVGRSAPLTVVTESGVLNLPVPMLGLQSFVAAAPVTSTLNAAPAPGGNLLLSWGVDDCTYVVDFADSLAGTPNWQPVSGTPVVNGNQCTLTVPLTGTQRVYRLRVP